ncbi:MAG: amino acid ABC transporter permease [Nitriliruptor sp.]|uniref:amino acid ABC transporter permease n=1 Tax=Nitriliruptor sp. TaxID=2448056 RepID=UPI0034A05EB2
MSASVLTEELGPRGRARVRYATIAASIVLAAFVGMILYRLYAEGQFAPRLWSQFVDFDAGWPSFLVAGLWDTLRAAVAVMVLASIIGLFLALVRLSPSRPFRFLAGLVIDVFRGPPVLLFIYFSFFALPQLLPAGLGNTISRNALYALIIGLTLYHMAVLAEVFRAGILSLDRGQREAALGVGMTEGKAMRLVILPQALRRMIPTIVAQLATITKDTSLGFIIGLSSDLTGRGRAFAQGSPINDLQTWVGVGVLYFIIIWGLSRLARRLEVVQRAKLGAGAIDVAGEADLGALAEAAEEDVARAAQGDATKG